MGTQKRKMDCVGFNVREPRRRKHGHERIAKVQDAGLRFASYSRTTVVIHSSVFMVFVNVPFLLVACCRVPVSFLRVLVHGEKDATRTSTDSLEQVPRQVLSLENWPGCVSLTATLSDSPQRESLDQVANAPSGAASFTFRH